jgi:energy-coupling factor transport system ATP-binding protein
VAQEASPEPVLVARGLTVVRGGTVALRETSVTLGAGTVTALMGRNGSGKSTLLWTLQGTRERRAGTVSIGSVDPAVEPAARRRELVGLVPQTAADLLYLESVADECSTADASVGDPGSGRCRALLDRLVPGVPDDAHPRDLSEGQRLALALAVVLLTSPPVVLLDEPTRGLDYPAKAELARVLRDLARQGHAVMVATHDVEFAAEAADVVVVLAEGEVVSAGTTREVLAASPAFAPQVTKILGPGWLRVSEVRS